MTLFELEIELNKMDKWFEIFLTKHSDKMTRKAVLLWNEYNLKLNEYIRLKQEYRLLQLG